MKLTVLEPGHFHAALLQRKMYADIDPTVDVYAQEGPELADYVRRVEAFNRRPVDPTAWRLAVHAGPDFLERFTADRGRGAPGDIVVIAGNNRRKAEYLDLATAAGSHVLADKPMNLVIRQGKRSPGDRRSPSSPTKARTKRRSNGRCAARCPPCSKNIQASTSDGPPPDGTSSCRTPTTSATKLISARSPTSS
jgi:hypothetical protein